MRAATARVGLVSPRSTCESIGALTPLRSARSRSDSEELSRNAFTRAPITIGSRGSAAGIAASGAAAPPAPTLGLALPRRLVCTLTVAIRAYVITDKRSADDATRLRVAGGEWTLR